MHVDLVMSKESEQSIKYTRAQQIFKEAPEELQKLIRDILEKERRVMHRQRRGTIHQDLYKSIKTFIR